MPIARIARSAARLPRRLPFPRRLPCLLACLLLASPLLFGCAPSESSSTAAVSKELSADGAAPAARAKLTAEELLQRTLQAYASADSYQDHGEVRLSYRQNGELLSDKSPLAVAWRSPNKLSIRAYQLTLASDGEQLKAVVEDEASNDLDGQAVVRPAPARITLPELYRDGVLHNILNSGLGRHPLQLELLLTENPLQHFRGSAATKRLLNDAELDGRSCHRLQIDTPEGHFVFWIDPQSYVVRRLEFPTRDLAAQISTLGEVSELSLAADFRDAKLNEPPGDDVFQMQVPADARQVQFFVVPPQPLPSELFGKRPAKFSFTDLNGQTVDQTSLEGKIATLVWFNDHPACQAALHQLDQVYQQLKDHSQLQFYAICTEPSAGFSNDDVRKLASRWNVSVPVLRDLEAHGRDVFEIPWAPTLVVLNEKGVVQIVEVGANPNLAAELPGVLERLQAGDDLAAQIVQQAEQEREAYERDLARASGDAEVGSEVLEVPETPLAPQSEPEHLQVTQLWASDQLAAPGNILVVPGAGDAAKVLVHDGWRTIAELDLQGQVVARHEPPLPNQAAISYLRTATDSQGKRYYAASSLLGRQVFLFDQDWKSVAQYPAAGQAHDGLRDVQLADLDGNGQPELYVGFWGLVGVHGVNLEGEQQWRNRTASNVLTVTVAPPDEVGYRRLLVAGDQGSIVRINHYGNHDVPIQVEGHAIHQLYAASYPAGRAAYCGLSYSEEGQVLAVGLDAQLSPVWTYPLPAGVFRNQLQSVTSAPLLGDKAGPGQWIFAGPDGSVHLVGDDGQFRDQLATGQYLTGVQAAQLDGKPTLLLSTEKEISAWRVE